MSQPQGASARYHNQTLDLDGAAYENCHFINCQFRFRGIAPFTFANNRIEGTFWLHCLNDWHARHELLGPLRDEMARYGYRLENAIGSYNQWGDGPEFHGEWIFYRQDRWPTGRRLGDALEPAQSPWPVPDLVPKPAVEHPSEIRILFDQEG